MNNPKKNYLFTVVYQLLILIIPLITSPYLSRVVGVEGIGIYSYTYSIVYYFMLLTLLGVNNYGNRTIAKSRDNIKELSKNFWGIYLFQLLAGFCMLICYLFYIFVINSRYSVISLIEVIFVVSAMVDISWFFAGIEDFKQMIVKNTIIKIITLVLIFTCVKSRNDLWIYTLIMGSTTLVGQLLLWVSLIGKVNRVKITKNDITKHITKNLILFIPVIAVSLYKIMDKIMLGMLSNINEVGYYEQAEKIVNIPITIITALGTVMLPRISNKISKGEIRGVEKIISNSIKFVMFMSFAMCFGLTVIGEKFAIVYFGNDFAKSGILIMMLSITLPFISFANVLRTQYLIPNEKDNIYIGSVISGAIVNLVLNCILIRFYGAVGACIATIIAEVVVMVYQTIALRDKLPIKEYIRSCIPFFIKSLIMFIVIYPINYLSINSLIIVLLQIIFGVIIYFILNYKYINSIIDFKKYWRKIYKK